ncbi:MAG: hypothetical protein JKY81_02480 [Colwellia sp.]|nr:hypothetical protein [Colwellia sp.]
MRGKKAKALRKIVREACNAPKNFITTYTDNHVKNVNVPTGRLDSEGKIVMVTIEQRGEDGTIEVPEFRTEKRYVRTMNEGVRRKLKAYKRAVSK